MNVTLSLSDLGILLLGGTFLVLLIYGILIFKNFYETIKVIKKVVIDNQKNIDEVLEEAPSIAKHIESLSHDLSHNVKAVQNTFDQILGTTEVAASKFSEHTDVLSSIMGVVQVIYTIKSFFEHKKKWF
ncbi:DUF948 domain-containing protein [Anaerophilus nitritogenes]|uniref:DUF948 domain-containing protein n=1 Tax=Anaerophilus nitritogenes TaxID=2498136 RepID=UPI00101D0FE6|nr:DUF948 domain-containing protein [Anaerophilus nitritogenes]